MFNIKISKKKMLKEKKSVAFTIIYTVTLTIMIVWTLTLLYALFWVLASSLKDTYDYAMNKFWLPSLEFITWDNFSTAFVNIYVTVYPTEGIKNIYFWELLFNTLYLTLVSAFLSIFVPTIVSYVTAKYKFFFNKLIHGIVVFSMVVPISGSLSGTLQLMQFFGVYDNLYFGTIIMRWGFLGANFLYMYAAFKGVSDDYMDAAFIDGAGHFTVLFRIMLPMVKNVFTMFFLLQLIAWWNTWDFTLIYMPTHPNLAQAVYNIQTSSEPALTTKPVQLAVCLIVMIPAFGLFLAFKNQIMQQVSFGGLKG